MNKALPTDPPWLKRAFNDLGLREITGKGSNPRIVEMYALAKNAGIKDDSVAWCSAAMNAWMVEAGYVGTKSLLARSWLQWGNKLDTGRKIPRGAVLIFKRGASKWQGHVCLLVEDNGATLKVIGGNQSDAVTVAHYKRSMLLGARWPSTAEKAAPKKKPDPTYSPAPPPEVVVPEREEVPVEPAPEPAPPAPREPKMPDVVIPEVIPEEPKKKGFLRRLSEWASGLSGFGFLAYLTDWRVVLALGAVVITGLLVWHFFIRGERKEKGDRK